MNTEELYAKMLARLAVAKEEARKSTTFQTVKNTHQLRAAHISNLLEDLKRSQCTPC